MSESEQRIEALEIRLSYQEKTIQELSSQLYDQSQVIDRLEAAVRTMSSRLKDLHPGHADLSASERPPHY